MKRAFRTLKNKNDSVLEIALASGFDDQSAFTRCFKETFGYTPKEARKKLNIVNELDCVELSDPEIIALTDIPLQSITATGLYFESAPRAWNKLKAISHRWLGTKRGDKSLFYTRAASAHIKL